jgi:hypothetical protein
MPLPKHMLCIKHGKIIVRPIARFVTSERHLDENRVGPTQAIPFLEKGESIIYDLNGKTVIIGDWIAGEKVFIDGGK